MDRRTTEAGPASAGMQCRYCGRELLCEPGTEAPPRFCGHCGRPTRRRRGAAIGACVAVALLLGGAAWFLSPTLQQALDSAYRAVGLSGEPADVAGPDSLSAPWWQAAGGTRPAHTGSAEHQDAESRPLAVGSGAAPGQKPDGPGPGGPWAQVAFWSGEGVASTGQFSVGNEWAIEWTTRPGKLGAMDFIIQTTPADGSVATIDAETIGPGHGMTHKRGAGTYHLEVNSNQRWGIRIWDKR